MVASIWYAQYIFFRRYALSDAMTVFLTLLLLFVVLFYVYPLKFLFGVAFGTTGVTVAEKDLPFLFLIYGLGFAGVSLVLVLLHLHAYRKRDELDLSDWERLVTRVSMADHSATMMVGLLSAGLAQVVPAPATATVAGFAYFLVALPKFVAGSYLGRRGRALAKRPTEPLKPPLPTR